MLNPFACLSLTRPLAVLDLETTGTNPRLDRIVEIAVGKFRPDGSQTWFDCRLDPGLPIPVAATAIHGIADDDARTCPSFAEVAVELGAFLADFDLCGFNLKRFDLPFLLAEFDRAGVPFTLDRRAVLDVMQIDHRFEPRHLSAAVRQYLGRDHTGHRARADAEVAAAILERQLVCYPDLPREVATLHACLSEIDLAGRLRQEGGRLVLTFGKYRGHAVADVVQLDPAYLQWLLDQDFLPDFKRLLQQAFEHQDHHAS